MTDSPGWAPESCTLPTSERPLRAAEFDGLFATSLRSVERVDPTRLELTLVGSDLMATVADLTARETACCSFFTFTLSEDSDALQLDVTVPFAYVEVLDRLARQAATAAGLPA